MFNVRDGDFPRIKILITIRGPSTHYPPRTVLNKRMRTKRLEQSVKNKTIVFDESVLCRRRLLNMLAMCDVWFRIGSDSYGFCKRIIRVYFFISIIV